MRVKTDSQIATEFIQAIKFIITGGSIKDRLDGLVNECDIVNGLVRVPPPESVLDHVIKAALDWNFPPKACIKTFITDNFKTKYNYQTDWIHTINGTSIDNLDLLLDHHGYVVNKEPSLRSYARYQCAYPSLADTFEDTQENHLPNELVKFLEKNYQSSSEVYQAILDEFYQDAPFDLKAPDEYSNLSYESRLMLKKVLRQALGSLSISKGSFFTQVQNEKEILSFIIDYQENKLIDKVKSLFFRKVTTQTRDCFETVNSSSSQGCSVELTQVQGSPCSCHN